MIKHVLLMGALMVAIPAFAESPHKDLDEIFPICSGVKELSAVTMAKVYSVRTSSVDVTVDKAIKPPEQSYIVSNITAKSRDSACKMQWRTAILSCSSYLVELNCKTDKEIEAMRIRDEALKKAFRESRESETLKKMTNKMEEDRSKKKLERSDGDVQTCRRELQDVET